VLPYFGGERRILKRDAMLIRVETDKGIVGWAPGPATEKAKQAIETVVAPYLVGRMLTDPDALRIPFVEGPGRDWGVLKAYCAVEIALFDVVGKAYRVPVSELIGGRLRDRIRLYGSAGMYLPPTQSAEEAHAISELGFRACKMRAGIGPEDDLTTVRLMRTAVGPDFDLMVDAHSWWHMGDRNYVSSTIDRLAGELDKYHIAWLEEPLPPEDHDGYRRLKELDFVPLAAGEHEPTEHSFMDLIFSESVDYVQMDMVSQGGLPTARRLLAEVAHAGLRFAFHSRGTALEVIVAAQLGVCWPDMVVEWLEYPCYSTPLRAGMYPFPLAAEMLKDDVEIVDGDLVVPTGPGLGVEIDERVIEKYPWIPGPWPTWAFEDPGQVRGLFSDPSEKWPES
jgi:L-alanine-DL-glutamate epimerase-like enolase superfamily enzyme